MIDVEKINILISWSYQPLLGDDYYHYTCAECGKGTESIKRLSLSWVEVIHIALYNLSLTQPSRKPDSLLKYYHWKQDICTFIDANWSKFWTKARTSTWRNSVASCLSTGKRFVSAAKESENDQAAGLWALCSTGLPSTVEGKRSKGNLFDIDIYGNLVEDARRVKKEEKPKKKEELVESEKKRPNSAMSNSSGSSTSSKHKKSKKKKTEPTIKLYPDIDDRNEPVKMSKQPTHTAPQVKVMDDGYTLQNDKVGYIKFRGIEWRKQPMVSIKGIGTLKWS